VGGEYEDIPGRVQAKRPDGAGGLGEDLAAGAEGGVQAAIGVEAGDDEVLAAASEFRVAHHDDLAIGLEGKPTTQEVGLRQRDPAVAERGIEASIGQVAHRTDTHTDHDVAIGLQDRIGWCIVALQARHDRPAVAERRIKAARAARREGRRSTAEQAKRCQAGESRDRGKTNEDTPEHSGTTLPSRPMPAGHEAAVGV
jgi:hypothetical protein